MRGSSIPLVLSPQVLSIHLLGPKLNIPEQFIECMKANLAFFQNWEIEAGEKLLHSEHLLRVFTSEKQVSRWKELSESSAYALSFLDERELDKIVYLANGGQAKPKHIGYISSVFLPYQKKD
jgi:hypothetical protein